MREQRKLLSGRDLKPAPDWFIGAVENPFAPPLKWRAERLGKKPVIFPSNHGGFLGGEYGQRGDPDGFAATLRRVLATDS